MDDLFEPFRFVRRQATRQAQLTESAAAAGDLGARGFAAIIANIGNP
jgi:hypothetical protein